MDFAEQSKAVAYVRTIKSSYLTYCEPQKSKLRGIYQAVMSYTPEKDYDWQSALKVNFANQIEQLVTARITAKNPKVIVSLQGNPREIARMYYTEPLDTPENIEEFNAFVKEIQNKWAPALQRYLNILQDKANYLQIYRRLAKQLVRTGNAYAEVVYRYDLHRTKNKKTKKVETKVANEYPTIDPISFQELFIDPRYHNTNDSMAVIREHERVTLAELYAQQADDDDLMNLDQINMGDNQTNWDREQLYRLMIPTMDEPTEILTKTLTVDKFRGYYNPDGKPGNSQLYEIWTVNDAILIKYKPIARIGVHSAACFEDCEQHFGIGYVEPILGLQEEYNFKMNSSIEYINHALNRTFLWSENSGINPRDLIQANSPNGIITTTVDGPTALANFVEMPSRPIDPNYFNQQNELRSDMQTLSFTIDAGNPLNRGGSTDTATAVRAKFFDSNTVYADTLKHFEELVANCMYDIIDSLYENLDDDKIVAAMGEDEFMEIDKRVLEQAPLRYSIRCEVGSSSFDSIENRREDVLAKLTVAERAMANGVQVNMKEIFSDLYSTFEEEKPERFFAEEGAGLDSPEGLSKALIPGFPDMAGEAAEGLGPMQKLLNPNANLDNVGELSKEVVQGNIIPG